MAFQSGKMGSVAGISKTIAEGRTTGDAEGGLMACLDQG
jgi:hypothetical protein